MRIAYLSSACIPSRTANSIHVMKMCQAFSKSGHSVKLFANRDQRIAIDVAGSPYSHYGLDGDFILEYAHWPSFPWAGFWYGWNIARRAIKWRSDWVYGRNLAACYFSAVAGVPVVFEVHMPIEVGRPMVNFLLRRLTQMPAFRYLTVVTHALRQHYEKKWPDLEGRILVAPDGADVIDNTLIPKELNANAHRLQIGYTGHLYSGKGAELVVELARMAPEYDFHLVGGTESDLERWLSRDDLPHNLILHGYRSPHEIPSYLLAFDVVLLPNQPVVHAHGGSTDIGSWTSPLKLFEYMASGRPIICSDVPILQEVANHGENMMVCPWDQPEKWVNAIHRLEKDRKLREELGANAKKELIERYSWDARVASLIHEFQARS